MSRVQNSRQRGNLNLSIMIHTDKQTYMDDHVLTSAVCEQGSEQ